MPLNYWSDDPEFVGAMPVRQDIVVLPADEPKYDAQYDVDDQVIVTSRNAVGPKDKVGKLVLGWVVTETIGIAVVNSRGVAAGRKSTIVGKR
jgi:hypothetical protein